MIQSCLGSHPQGPTAIPYLLAFRVSQDVREGRRLLLEKLPAPNRQHTIITFGIIHSICSSHVNTHNLPPYISTLPSISQFSNVIVVSLYTSRVCANHASMHLKINPAFGVRAWMQPDTQSTIGPLERYPSPSGFAHAIVSSADHPFRQPWKIDAIAPDDSHHGP